MENGKQNGTEALSHEIVSMVKRIKRTERYKINQVESQKGNEEGYIWWRKKTQQQQIHIAPKVNIWVIAVHAPS